MSCLKITHGGDASYEVNNQQVVLTFLVRRLLPDGNGLTETKSLTLVEGMQSEAAPLKIATQAQAVTIQIGEFPGFYIIGAWDTSYDSQSQSMITIWRNDLVIQNIYWQSENIHLVLISDDDQLSQSDLIKIARSVK